MKVKIKNCEIKHIESTVPSKIIKNIDLDFDEKFKKKVIKNTGVKQRHVIEEDQSLLDLYETIGRKTLNSLDWDAQDIDGVIVVTQTPEYKLPATSAILQGALNLRNDCFAYDISMGCSGYIYGLYNAMSNIASSDGEIKKVLLFVGDAISTIVHPKNKSNIFLFGDAASCTAIEHKLDATHIPFILETNGLEYDNIIVEDGGLKNKISLSSFDNYIDDDGNINSKNSLKMNGAKVFNFTVNNIPSLVEKTLSYANLDKGDISHYCFHQANKFMIDFLSNKIGINERTPINIDKFGNTSCASIPLILTDFKLSSKHTMLIGFGVGMSMGSCIVNLEKTTFGYSVFQNH